MDLKSLVLANADAIRLIASSNRMERPRVFGSVARGDADQSSDIDILVDTRSGCDLFDVVEAERALSLLLGRPVDVRTIGDLHPKMRDGVLAEAVDL